MILPILLSVFVLFLLPGGQVLESDSILKVAGLSLGGFVLASLIHAVLIRRGWMAYLPALFVLTAVILEQYCPWPVLKTNMVQSGVFGFLVASWFSLENFHGASHLKRLSFLKNPASSQFMSHLKIFFSAWASWLQLAVVLATSIVFLKQFPPFQFEIGANLTGSLLYLCMASVCVLRSIPGRKR